MRHPMHKILAVAGIAVWTLAVGVGAAKLWHYDSTAGAPATAPLMWPAASSVSRQAQQPTLVLLVHPQCPCSRATLDNLSRLMTTCAGKLQATVLFVRPEGMPAGWEHTDLWTSAAAIPGVAVAADEDGLESRRFGAATSGQTLLYATDGRLLFSGGITESRGHSGDNAGESAIESLVLATTAGAPPQPLHTPVYGCALFDASGAAQKKGCPACPQ